MLQNQGFFVFTLIDRLSESINLEPSITSRLHRLLDQTGQKQINGSRFPLRRVEIQFAVGLLQATR